MKVERVPAPPLPAGRPRLVVSGFMGTGKTEAGRRAAALLGLPFLDLDDAVERREGRTVTEIFAERGEPAFRALEREAVLGAARLSGIVVGTGGGAVVDPGTYAALADGAVAAVLECRPEELIRRLDSGPHRPLLAPEPGPRVRQLLAQRAEAYAAAGVPLDTTERTPASVAEELADRYRAGGGERLARVEVPGPDGPYPVLIGDGALDALAGEIGDGLPAAGSAALVTDPGAAGMAERTGDALRGAGLRVHPPLEVPQGEAAKTIEVLGRLWEGFRDLGLERTDVVVAVGGGAVLDVAGLAAATYARGLPLANVPTTVLAMADAALGGKVALNHAGVKNLAGAFHHPRAVAADPAALGSLDPRVVRAGLGEVVKAAVIAAPMALEVLSGRSATDTMWAVEQAVRVKAAVVGSDPTDAGARHALNLGHTFAHAIESATDHAVPHGEAVAVGLGAAARLGHGLGITPPRLERRIDETLRALGLPTAPPPGLDPEAVVGAMESDKKRRRGRIRFVVPTEDGIALVEGPGPREALEALLSAERRA